VVQDTFAGVWLNLGVDVAVLHVTPPRAQPGIGLRPGAGRPDVEALVPALYGALFDSVAAHARRGLHVVVDVGLHDAHGAPLPRHPLGLAADAFAGLPVLLVGVRCPLDEIVRRRDAGQPGREGTYARSGPGGTVPDAARRWQDAVHVPGIYDVEVDTSVLPPEACAAAIAARLADGPSPTALARAAAATTRRPGSGGR
jgi:chloramphenicol 3-O phosphotransferase